ncbi:MAG: nucleotidyl transferase AbiEii/AbiGii toxin family protein [Bacilli bacterium]
MERQFENDNKLKGYLSNQAKKNNISSNYAYTYFFLRCFLEILNKNNDDLIITGSFSNFAHTKKIYRPITDLDLQTKIENLDNFDNTVSNLNDNNLGVNFNVKQRFVTENGTINYRILCNFGKLERIIKSDIKIVRSAPFSKVIIPKLFDADSQMLFNVTEFEKQIADKLCIIIRKLYTYKNLNNEYKRYKDIYDISNIVKNNKEKIDFDKVLFYVKSRLQNDDLIKDLSKQDILNLLDILNQKFLENNEKSYNEDAKKFQFMNKIDNNLKEVKQSIKRSL